MIWVYPSDAPESPLPIQRHELRTTLGPRFTHFTSLIKDQVDPIKVWKKDIRIGGGNAIFNRSIEDNFDAAFICGEVVRTGVGQVVPAHYPTASQIDVSVRKLPPIMIQTGIGGPHPLLIKADRMRCGYGSHPQNGHKIVTHVWEPESGSFRVTLPGCCYSLIQRKTTVILIRYYPDIPSIRFLCIAPPWWERNVQDALTSVVQPIDISSLMSLIVKEMVVACVLLDTRESSKLQSSASNSTASVLGKAAVKFVVS